MKKKLQLKTWLTIILIPIYIATVAVSIIMISPSSLNFKIKSTHKLNGNVVYVEGEEEFPYLYKSDGQGGYSQEEFKLLVFSDTHLDSYLYHYSENTQTIDMMRKNIETVKPDLIILDGDNVTSTFTRGRAIGLAEMMEAYGVYWAPVYGNHDTENFTAISRNELTALWSSYPHCLIRQGNVYGSGNYIINIKTSENTISKSLIFMDSGDYMSKDEKSELGYKKDETVYDYIHQDQINWYSDSVAEIKNQYGNNSKSLLFFHIAIPEYLDAYEEGTILYGEKREGIGCSKKNSGMFDAIIQNGSTEAIFVGHDHINDYEALYQGVRFVYCQSSGYTSYDVVSKFNLSDSDRLQGCLVVNIGVDGSYNIERIINSSY